MAESGLLELWAENYKSLRSVRLQPGRLSVLVGPNGAGKSNLLDVLQFLGDSVRSDLGPALDRRGGYDRVRFRGQGPPGPVKIGIKANVTRHSSVNAPDEYELTFWTSGVSGIPGAKVLVRREEFSFKRVPGRGRRINVHGATVEVVDDVREGPERIRRRRLLRRESLGLATLPKLASNEGGEQVQQIAELFSSFRVFDVDVRGARLPSPVTSSTALSSRSQNLAAFLRYLSESHPDTYGKLISDARELVPGLSSITVREVGGAGEGAVVELEEKGLAGVTQLGEASHGTVRALAVLAMLHDPAPPLLTCVEEIDQGLHPYAFDVIVARLREASQRTQFIIATHSPALVNRLSSDELIVCERDPSTGASRIPAIDRAKVRAIESELDGHAGLGEIWFSGTLGGVPV